MTKEGIPQLLTSSMTSVTNVTILILAEGASFLNSNFAAIYPVMILQRKKGTYLYFMCDHDVFK